MNIIHALDQLSAMLRDLAPVLYKYHNELVKAGFTEEQAMQLVCIIQESIVNPRPSQPGE